MTVRRFSISLDEDLAEAVTSSAESSNETLSSWLAEAAQRRVRQDALLRAVEDYEREFGVINEEDVALGFKQLDARTTAKRPATKRRAA